jgi:hypothetical protein
MTDTTQQPPISDRIRSLTEKARQWALSQEGRDALSKTVQEAVSLTKRIQDAQRVDPKVLQEPITR